MASLSNSVDFPVSGRPSLWSAITTWYEQYRIYKKTRDELSVLNNRDLNDIGISRGQIEGIARKAAEMYRD